jgi:uncharacterized protein (UPF0303 family)
MPHPLPEYTIADLEAIEPLELPRLTRDDAVELGMIAVGVIREWQLNLCVNVVVGDVLVFSVKLGNTDRGNDEWLSGKAEAVRAHGESSLMLRRRREAAGETELEAGTMKFHGGCVPLFVAGQLAGTITMSGEKDVVDHEASVEAVHRYQRSHSS